MKKAYAIAATIASWAVRKRAFAAEILLVWTWIEKTTRTYISKRLKTMNELFFHECRAAGLVFKTSDDWFKWLTDNGYDIKKPVAEHEGFKYTIKDFCINPHVIEYSVEGADNWGWKVTTAKTQFGWIWGFSIQNGKTGYDSPVGYPSRYDTLSIFYGSEAEAVQDALTYIIGYLSEKAVTKNVNLLIWAAKKKRADIVHPQMELFK